MAQESGAKDKKTMRRWWYLLSFSLLGGMFGTVAAFFKELAFGGGVIVVMLIAPIVEEVLKPVGVFHLLNRHSTLFSSRWQVAVLSALGGAVFASFENLLYLYVYHPNPTTSYVAYRLVICTLLHVICSGILGWGVSNQLAQLQKQEDDVFFDLEKSWGWVVFAIAIHALFNTSVIFLSALGIQLS